MGANRGLYRAVLHHEEFAGDGPGSSGYLYLEKGKDLLGINDRAYALQSGLPSNGTCSFADGSCVEVSENSCSALGSNFGRLGSICPIPCASATTAIERAPALSIAATAAFLLVCLMLGYRRLRPSRATV